MYSSSLIRVVCAIVRSLTILCMSQELSQYLAKQHSSLQNPDKNLAIAEYVELKQVKAYLQEELQIYLDSKPDSLHVHARVDPDSEEQSEQTLSQTEEQGSIIITRS